MIRKLFVAIIILFFLVLQSRLKILLLITRNHLAVFLMFSKEKKIRLNASLKLKN